MDDVQKCAEVLQCTPLEVFKRAYKAYYGHLSEEDVHNHFRYYKNSGWRPSYITKFAHETLRCDK